MSESYEFKVKRSCKNCVHCEMYHKENALCYYREKWVESNFATYCDDFLQEGDSNE